MGLFFNNTKWTEKVISESIILRASQTNCYTSKHAYPFHYQALETIVLIQHNLRHKVVLPLLLMMNQ